MHEKTYLKLLDLPYLRIRVYFATQGGDVKKFVVQLEYNLSLVTAGMDRWVQIARFDHNPSSVQGHDIREEGLHLDLIDLGREKADVKRGFPNVVVNEAVDYCERYFEHHGKTLAKDFERRNGITDGHYYP